jgi:stage II sporulation protein D
VDPTDNQKMMSQRTGKLHGSFLFLGTLLHPLLGVLLHPLLGVLLHPIYGWATIDPVLRHGPLFLPKGQPVEVRVKISDPALPAIVRGFDLQMFGEKSPVLTWDRESSWRLTCFPGKVKATRIFKFSGNPDSKVPDSLEFQSPVTIQSPSGFIHFNDRPYRQEIRVYSRNQCEVVNHVDLEKYLDGLVNSEFSSKWNEEAIAAQIVAARTYAFYQIVKARQTPELHYDLDSSVKDQVYQGFHREDFHSSRAVNKTRGLILTAGRDSIPIPIKAFYHSTCGGVTEVPKNVWGNSYPGMGKHILCPYCSVSPAYRWSLDLSTPELEEILRKGAGGSEPKLPRGHLIGLEPKSTNPSGRVVEIRTLWQSLPPISSSGVQEFTISAVKLRDWIGPGKFRSTRFRVEPSGLGTETKPGTGKRWHFEGMGNGHGVGMCQWGAKTMAEKHYRMMAILKHYYPEAILRKLW